MEKIGGSIGFQLIHIFNIIEDKTLTEEEKRKEILEYQKGLTQEGTGLHYGKKGENVQCMKDGFYVFGDVDVMSYEDLLKIKEHVDKNLDSFTCEAEMKMSSLIGGYNKETGKIKYNFKYADKIYNYANSHGKIMRGHTLVWHKHEPPELDEFIADQYEGNYEEDKANNTAEFKAQRKELTKQFLALYMQAVGEKYPNCYCWDVLNEIVPQMHTPQPSEEERKDGLRHSKWFEYLGKDFYIDVLEIARKNLPEGTKLFYNDFGEQHPQKRKAILQVIENIKEYEKRTGRVILDGIGLQSHYDLTMEPEQIKKIYEDFAKTGKEIQVTEMDVSWGLDENGDPKNWRKRYEC